MNKVCVIGHFGLGKNLLNGQTIKTKIITQELEKRIGKKNVFKIDTHGGVISYLKLPFQIFNSLISSKNIIILPAHNGVRAMSPMLSIMNYMFKRRLHYVVIGGWLPELLKKHSFLRNCLKHFSGIYVETKTMKKALEEQGFNNIYIMPNGKSIRILKENELVYTLHKPFRLCTFSRVMKEKGIQDAIESVKSVNEQNGRTVYLLDVYGQVEEGQEEWFKELRNTFPDYIHYCGKVNYNDTTDVLKNYFALLFPTKFFTEGIPGTIIDAYAAGIPVISSEWESFSDVIDDKITGMGYKFNDINELKNILLNLSNTPEILNELKINCLLRANDFTASKVVEILLCNLG